MASVLRWFLCLGLAKQYFSSTFILINCYMRTGAALKACSDCRNSWHIKKRARRSKFAEANAQLSQSPMLKPMVVENSNRRSMCPDEAFFNLLDISTTTISSTIEPGSPFTSALASDLVASDT